MFCESTVSHEVCFLSTNLLSKNEFSINLRAVMKGNNSVGQSPWDPFSHLPSHLRTWKFSTVFTRAWHRTIFLTNWTFPITLYSVFKIHFYIDFSLMSSFPMWSLCITLFDWRFVSTSYLYDAWYMYTCCILLDFIILIIIWWKV